MNPHAIDFVDVSGLPGYRRYTLSDSLAKDTDNPLWMRLPVRARFAHDQIERKCGRNNTGGRVRLGRTFSSRMWQQWAGVTKRTVETLIESGWARWEGEDFILQNYPAEPERRWIQKQQMRRALRNVRVTSFDQKTALISDENTALSGAIAPVMGTKGSVLPDLGGPPPPQQRQKAPPPPPLTGGGGWWWWG